MNDLALIAAIVSPAVLVVFLVVVLEWRRRHPSVQKQLDDAWMRTARRCERGFHEWVKPWNERRTIKVYGQDVTADLIADRLPIRHEATYETTCMHCGIPHTERVEV